MATIRCYTGLGVGAYPDHNYPGHVGRLCDLEHAMYLAYSLDGKVYHSLRNNTGILFPACTFTEGKPEGTTKTLVDPFLFRSRDGGFMVCAVRRNQNAPDPLTRGSIMLFSSPDLAHYQEVGFLRVADGEIRRPACRYDAAKARYRVSWEAAEGRFMGWTEDFTELHGIATDCEAYDESCEISVSDEELAVIRGFLDEIHNTGVAPMEHTVHVGEALEASDFPKAVCLYSDGSTHAKQVDWDADAIASVDVTKAGVYAIPGTIRMKHWDAPCSLNYGHFAPGHINDPHVGWGMSDPCVTYYHGKYYLSSTGIHHIVLRCADRLEDVFRAEPIVIHSLSLKPGERFSGTWAAELHEINGILYMFTAICPDGDWMRVYAVVLRCHGDPCDQNAWESPRACVKPNGQPCTERGISLDMTYFRDEGRDYVLWSDRKIDREGDRQIIEPADIYIATVDPGAPWQMTSEPRCIARPIYGWERCETEVIEAPYLLRHGRNLFVTISGSSTGMADLYAVGLLHARSGADLTDPAAWSRVGYPLLTKESVPGEYGPGHNNFVVDHETGDTMLVYHAVPHDEQDRSLNRQPYIRRVHWSKAGLPYLEMTPERELKNEFRRVVLTLKVQSSF